MKCPECIGELDDIEQIPFAKNCDKCHLTWIIQTAEQSYQMGLLNTELLSRNDLSSGEKIKRIIKRAHELEKKT